MGSHNTDSNKNQGKKIIPNFLFENSELLKIRMVFKNNSNLLFVLITEKTTLLVLDQC